MQNNSHQAVQHCLESQLIEVMIERSISIQFASNVIVIQMRSMKESHKNSSNKEFQHCVESISIQVMIEKMLPIQFVSSVNLIQRKSTAARDALPESQLSSESRLAEFENHPAQRV
jgi:hypothetical protein